MRQDKRIEGPTGEAHDGLALRPLQQRLRRTTVPAVGVVINLRMRWPGLVQFASLESASCAIWIIRGQSAFVPSFTAAMMVQCVGQVPGTGSRAVRSAVSPRQALRRGVDDNGHQ